MSHALGPHTESDIFRFAVFLNEALQLLLDSCLFMYYWNILQMDETELVKKVFTAQKISPCKDDWNHQIIED